MRRRQRHTQQLTRVSRTRRPINHRHRHNRSLHSNFSVNAKHDVHEHNNANNNAANNASNLFSYLRHFNSNIRNIVVPVSTRLTNTSRSRPHITNFKMITRLIMDIVHNRRHVSSSLQAAKGLIHALVRRLHVKSHRIITNRSPYNRTNRPRLRILAMFHIVIRLLNINRQPRFSRSNTSNHHVTCHKVRQRVNSHHHIGLRYRVTPSLSLSTSTQGLPPYQIPNTNATNRHIATPPTAHHLPLHNIIADSHCTTTIDPNPHHVHAFSQTDPRPSSLYVMQPTRTTLAQLTPRNQRV